MAHTRLASSVAARADVKERMVGNAAAMAALAQRCPSQVLFYCLCEMMSTRAQGENVFAKTTKDCRLRCWMRYSVVSTEPRANKHAKEEVRRVATGMPASASARRYLMPEAGKSYITCSHSR